MRSDHDPRLENLIVSRKDSQLISTPKDQKLHSYEIKANIDSIDLISVLSSQTTANGNSIEFLPAQASSQISMAALGASRNSILR